MTQSMVAIEVYDGDRYVPGYTLKIQDWSYTAVRSLADGIWGLK